MITVRLEGVEALVADFNGASARAMRASVRALNRALGSARTLIVREIARDTGLRQSDVRDALTVVEATFDRPVARLSSTLDRLPLFKFNARGSRRGVTYRLRGGAGRVDHAFIATMRSGHQGVFMRVTGANRRGPKPNRSQLPIRELQGPSLGQVFAKYRAAGLARAQEIFERNFAHEMDYAGSGSGDASGSE